MSAPGELEAADFAAVMVMLLEEEQAAKVLAELAPAELRLLGEKMCGLGDIRPDFIARSIAGFVAANEQHGLSAHNRVGKVRSLMTHAVGEVKADSLMHRIAPDAPASSPLELVRWLTPQVLAPLIRDEHPQAIAVLLIQLDPEVAAEVLHDLPAEVQPEVVHRIATMGPVSSDALAMLEEMIANRIGDFHGRDSLSMGGLRDAADLINNSGKDVESRVMARIAKADKALAKRLENEMFKFEHLLALDPQSMGSLLREVESSVLIDALKGIAEDERETFFLAMSSRAADGVRDEIEARGRLRMADVIEAQREVVATARRLADDGIISFGTSEDEYV